MSLNTASNDLLDDGGPWCPPCGRSRGEFVAVEDHDASVGKAAMESCVPAPGADLAINRHALVRR